MKRIKISEDDNEGEIEGTLERVVELPTVMRFLVKAWEGYNNDFKIKVDGAIFYKRDWTTEQAEDKRYSIENLKNYLGKRLKVKYKRRESRGITKFAEMLHFCRNLPGKYRNIESIEFIEEEY